MKRLAVIIALTALSLPVGAQAASRAGVVTMAFDLSAHPSTADTRLWVPYPVSDRDQVVTGIRISGDFAESSVTTDRVYSTPMLFARWDKGAKSRKLVLSFHVVRQEAVRRDFPATEVAWDPADYRRYLAPTSLGPTDGKVKALADEITAGKTGVRERAKAIYDWIVENMYRDPDVVGCGLGDVEALLRRPGGKCTDIHSVFVALARAAGIPSREIFGIRLGKTDTADITRWQHCWAEFYLPGYDWVPVDPADVRKMMLRESLTLDDPRTIAYRKYFWGSWDPYRVKLAVGRDLLLNPPQKGAPLNTFGYPYAEVGGKPLDFYDPEAFSYRFTFSEK